ncbi:MAG TPA: 50S ribosomal protein L25 [Candidatus Baltobacteraceae bacterium]|nr:50S ribosomal protein L25 [Candidatus Baltobacteraceae bacterium]
MSRITESLAVAKRTKVGSTTARALRRHGRIPGVLFGHGSGTIPFSVDLKAFEDVVRRAGTHSLLTVVIDGTGSETALVREVQRDPVTRRAVHADLQRISAGESVTEKVNLVPIGIPEGVKTSGGVLDIVMHDVEISGPASDLPAQLEVDVTSLEIGGHITAAEIPLPPGFKLLTDPEIVVISVEAPRAALIEAVIAPVISEIPTVAETTKGTEPTKGAEPTKGPESTKGAEPSR